MGDGQQAILALVETLKGRAEAAEDALRHVRRELVMRTADGGLCDELTKRELFAGLAMMGLCANEPMLRGNHYKPEPVVSSAVVLADRLLAELAKTEPNP